jgi:protocatechuate 3,4-dioxygenase beta subunit
VRRARVNLSGQGVGAQRSSLTDEDGRYVFTQLPAGRYSLSATKAGFVTIAYGAKAPGRAGTPIQLADAQKLEAKAVTLPKGGVVTGVVLDEHGEPAPGTPVRAMRQVMRTGEKRVESAGSDTTDDRGQYRIYGLQPGKYIVSAQPRNQGGGALQANVAAQIEAAMQDMQQVLGATQLGGRGAAGQGGGGGGGGRAGQLGDLLGQLGGGRGQQVLEQLQQQLNPDAQQSVAYAPVFFPGTTSASQATTVEITTGQERYGVDFQLQLTQTSQVSGSILGPDGTVPTGAQITLVPKDSLPGLPGNSMTARAGQDGVFTFRNVIPGQYSITARAQVRAAVDPAAAPPAPAAPAGAAQGGRGGGRGGAAGRGGPPPEILWAVADVVVDDTDQSGVMLQLQNGMTITGRVTFDGQRLLPPTDLTRVRVNLNPVGPQDAEFGNIPAATVDDSGRFTIKGVPPGRYSLRGNAPAGTGGPGVGAGGATQAGGAGNWILASSVAGGRDSLDFALVIGPNVNVSDAVVTFADRSTELTGMLQDAAGTATSDYSIIIFPFDKEYWQPQSRRIQSVRPGTDGRFTIRNLPPGDYMIVAVVDVEPGEWFDPAFLAELAPASMRLTLKDGEKKTQDIRLAGGR